MVDHKGDLIAVGIISIKNTVGIFAKINNKTKSTFCIIWNKHGAYAHEGRKEVVIKVAGGKKENPRLCDHFQFTQTIDGWVMSYIRTEKSKRQLVIAIGYDLYDWTVKSTLDVEDTGATLLQSPGKHGNYLLYMSGLFFTYGHSKDLKHWVREPQLLLTSRSHEFDNGPLTLFGSVVSKRGNVIFYDASYKEQGLHILQVGAAIFSKEDPTKIIWRSEAPLWKGVIHEHEGTGVYPLGITIDKNTVTFYWASKEGGILNATISIPFAVQQPRTVPKDHLHLVRARKNPILEPVHSNDWESEAVFNPAAVYDNGKIHLFYRAIGRNGISVLGYASSKDGIHIDRRLEYPVYEPGDDYGPQESDEDRELKKYDPYIYSSGGGWSGYEDPRAVKIGKRIYITYLAFGGWNSMRIALTSISEKDLEKEIWNWDKPTFISPPGEIHKNWVLFPEKIHGKFAILHGISPDILIHYVDSLQDFEEIYIKSHPPKGGRLEYWDNRMRGVGPPPIKTKLGWLVLYHANDMLEPHRYKLGAMILDKNDPKKILYRASHPILSPDMHYENDGKPGIVYASGAVIKDGRLLVYYGGGDRVVCVASIPLDTLLEKIKKDKVFSFEPKNSLIT